MKVGILVQQPDPNTPGLGWIYLFAIVAFLGWFLWACWRDRK